jgi:glycosyltransferase involved in cell wall biosynthesis
MTRFRAPENVVIKLQRGVPYSCVAEFLGASDILVFPTLADEWGMVVQEALAAGVPVCGSLYSQAVEEFVRPGLNGWTFRPDRPREMAEALEAALATDRDKLDTMRVNARKSVESVTPEFVANGFLNVVRSVV